MLYIFRINTYKYCYNIFNEGVVLLNNKYKYNSTIYTLDLFMKCFLYFIDLLFSSIES